MNGIMYLRKSRDDENYERETGQNVLQLHRERLTLLCNSKGISFIERAEVVSGDTIAGRPKFQQVLNDDIPSGQYNCVIITEISRLGRGDMEDAGKIYKTIINYSIKLVTPNRTYDPTNPSDLRQLRFELFMSREEYEGIKERLWNNRNYKATKGFAGNYIPVLGFRQFRGKMEIIPEEAAVVNEIFNMRAECYSYDEIAAYLNTKNLITKRGTKYHASTINKITHNPRYIGISKWKGEEYKAQHDAIIPIDLWEKVCVVNEERTHTRRGNKTDNPYLVELYCHECGRRMYGEHHKSTKIVQGVKRTYAGTDFYICKGRKSIAKCTHQITASLVHDKIFYELQKILSDKDVFDEMVKQREASLGGNTDNLQSQIKDLNKQIKEKTNFLQRAETDYERGDISGLLYTKHVEKAKKEISAIESRINKLKQEISKSKVKVSSPDELKSILQKLVSNWSSLANENKKAIINSFLPRVEVDKQKTFYISRALPISFFCGL